MPFVTAALEQATHYALPVSTQATQRKAQAYVSQLVLTMPPTSIKMARPANSAIHFATPVLQLAALLVSPVLPVSSQSKAPPIVCPPALTSALTTTWMAQSAKSATPFAPPALANLSTIALPVRLAPLTSSPVNSRLPSTVALPAPLVNTLMVLPVSVSFSLTLSLCF